MLSLLPTLASFLGNRYQVSVQDLFLPVIVDLLTAALVVAVFYRSWRKDALAAGLAAGLLVLVLVSNYDGRLSTISPIFDAVSPFVGVGWVYSLVFMVLLGALAAAIGRLASRLVRLRGWSSREIVRAATIAVSVTFAIQVATVVQEFAVEWPQFFYKAPALTTTAAATPASPKPDIYYIVLDRYASQDVLASQFGFNNDEFIQFLKDNHYYVNPSAHNNYPYTTMSIASTMSADYNTSIVQQFENSTKQTVIPFNETIRQAPVAQTLQKLGYSYNLVGNWYETSNESPVADHTYQQTGIFTLLGHTFTLDNFPKIILSQSIFSRFIQASPSIGQFQALRYTNLGDVDMAHYQLQTLKDLAAAPPGGRFIFAHILVPHDPYNFNADGSISTTTNSDNIGAPVKQKYLGQVQYINGQMKTILSNIQSASRGQAVVVLQSDEGPYPAQLNDEDFDANDLDGLLQAGDMRQWSDANLQMKFGNLAAYHIPAADWTRDTDAADSVNIFRLILNSYFGAGMSYLPDCYYAYPNGRDKPLSFTSITTRLTGAAEDSRCGANGGLKP